jgi:uncharacterized membrane protein
MKSQNQSFGNYVLLALLVFIQSVCFYNIIFESNGIGNRGLDLRILGLFIYLFSFLYYYSVKSHLFLNALWTIGFCLLFLGDLTSVSGALIILVCVWINEKEKSYT